MAARWHSAAILGLAGLLGIAGLRAWGEDVSYGPSVSPANPSFVGQQTTTPTPVVTATIDQTQASGSALVAFSSTTSMAAGQTVSGTNIPAGAQISSIVSTAQVTLAANGVSNSGQKVLTTTATAGSAVGQLCVDLTTPTAIGAGNVIASIQAGVSITMTSNLAAATVNADSITCDPTVTLTQVTSGAASGSVTFYANHTALSTAAALVDNGDASIYGNLAIGGSISIAPNGLALTSGGITMVGTALRVYSNGGTQAISIATGGNLTLATATTVSSTLTNTGIGSDATHTDATVCEDTTSHLFLVGSGAAGICLGTSSLRFKKDWGPLREGLDTIMSIKPIHYRYREGYGTSDRDLFGFAAEQVYGVAPKLVGLDAEGRPNSVDWAGVVPILVHAIQEQQHEINELKGRRHAIRLQRGG